MLKSPSPDKKRNGEYGQSWEIAAALQDGPKTQTEIVDHFYSYARLVGLFRVTKRMERRHGRMAERIEKALEELIERGWVEHQGDRYALTAQGREQGKKVLADMRKTSTRLRKLAQPQTASQVGLGVHLALAALKLPAALLSGSVGLLNDATDTLLDGISSVLVYLGLRWKRERAANIVLVLLMLVTGGLTFYEAARRFLVPSAPEADWFTFSATILSALVCLALGLYQRFVGLRSGSLALITQSVDSRNHVITAASVTAGLVASLLSFPLLDTLVGLAVAGLILKSAIELTIELVRTLGDDDVDLGHYQMGIAEWYEQFRQTQLRDWMLYVVEKQNVHTRQELIAQAQQVIDVSGNPTLRELGVQQQPGVESLVETCLSELLKREWLLENGQLRLADAAREHLNRQMKAKEHSKALILTRRKNVSQRNEIYFKMMSFIHETLYGVFRDPYQVLTAAGLKPSQRVLEVGCGPGFFTVPAAEIVGEQGNVLSLDVNPIVIEHVRSKIEESGAQNARAVLANANATGLPDQGFDLAFVFGLARPGGSMEGIWTEVHRLLKPEGTLAVEGRLQPPSTLFQQTHRQGRIVQYVWIE